MTAPKKYKVMMFEQLAGHLSVEKGNWTFRYEEAYRNKQHMPPVSHSLPKTAADEVKGLEIFPFFDGLLPEGWIVTSFEHFDVKIETKEEAVGLFLKDPIGAVSLQSEAVNRGRDKIKKIQGVGAEDFFHKSPDELVASYVNSLKTDEEKRYVNERLLAFAFRGLARIEKARKCLICLENLHAPGERFYHSRCARKVFNVERDVIAATSLETFSRDAISSISSGAVLAGYQPKAQLFVPYGDERPGGTELILKPDVIVDAKHRKAPRGIPIFEHLTMRAAESMGITVAPSAVIPFLDGSLGYATRRYDRLPGILLHAEDMHQALGGQQDEDGKNKYKGSIRDMADVFRANSERLALPYTAITKQLALLTVFNLSVGNHDAHLKNHSLLYLLKQLKPYQVTIAPAYDLLPLHGLTLGKSEEAGLFINGKKSNITPADVIAEFKAFGAERQAREAFETLFDKRQVISDTLLEHLAIFGLEEYSQGLRKFFDGKQAFYRRMMPDKEEKTKESAEEALLTSPDIAQRGNPASGTLLQANHATSFSASQASSENDKDQCPSCGGLKTKRAKLCRNCHQKRAGARGRVLR